MEYRVGKGKIVGEIIKAFGLAANVSVEPGGGVELRETDEFISLTAAVGDKSAILEIYDAGKTILRETNKTLGVHFTTTLWTDGRVDKTAQGWDKLRGPTGEVAVVDIPNTEDARQRIISIAHQVLPLGREIK